MRLHLQLFIGVSLSTRRKIAVLRSATNAVYDVLIAAHSATLTILDTLRLLIHSLNFSVK